MSQESIVYGCIKDLPFENVDTERRKANCKAMMELPSADEWPYLCKEMFSLPRIEVTGDRYLTEVIHFGASYQAIEYEWSQWMKRFETLLEKMYWVSAVVHLETELTGVHTFTWLSKRNSHEPGAGRTSIHCEWTQDKVF